MFSRGIEMGHWAKMGYQYFKRCYEDSQNIDTENEAADSSSQKW